MEWKMESNGNFGMEYERFQNGMEWKISRMEWNGRFQEWNGRQFSILLYQFHTRFHALYLRKNTYGCRVVVNDIVTEVFNFNVYAYCLSVNRCTLVVYITQTVYTLHHSKYIAISSIDVIVDVFDKLYLFFYFEIDSLPRRNFFFFHRHKTLYLLFHPRFSLILFIFVAFKLLVILFGV